MYRKHDYKNDYDIEGIKKMFLEDNLTTQEVCEFWGLSNRVFAKLQKEYSLYKTPEQKKAIRERAAEKQKKVLQNKYGVVNPSQLDTVKEKKRVSYEKKTDSEKKAITDKQRATIAAQTQEQKEQSRKAREKTCLDTYGVVNVFQSETIKEQIKQTNIGKYGTPCASQSEQIKTVIKKTVLDKYGVESALQLPQVKQGMMDKYGTLCPLQVPELLQKAKDTNLMRYGVEYKKKENIPPETLTILDDCEKLKLFCERFVPKKTIFELSEILQCNYLLLQRRLRAFNLQDCVDFKPTRSSYEDEIYTILREWDMIVEKNNKEVLDNKQEIDLYLPELKIGIEFNGSYWHSSLFKDRNYHYNKSLQGQQKGIFIYHIFEYEWIDSVKREKIINQLRNLCKKNTHQLGGRQTIVLPISKQQKAEFLDKYHLQGNDKSSMAFGLFWGELLVSVMTFCCPRFSTHCNWELSRYCVAAGWNVSGGANKLFQYAITHGVDGSILSYSDIGKTQGTMYETLGFEFQHVSPPNYVWINLPLGDIKTRYQTQMKNEKAIMEQQGYVRIYDCGNITWVYSPSKNKKEEQL